MGPGQPFAFFIGIALIAFGFIPYKRLCRVEERPISLRCTLKHLELTQKRRTRHLPVDSLKGFTQQATYLHIELEQETIQLAHFPPGTAARLQELYFQLTCDGL